MRHTKRSADDGTVAIKMRLPYEATVALKQESIGRSLTIGEIVLEALQARVIVTDHDTKTTKVRSSIMLDEKGRKR